MQKNQKLSRKSMIQYILNISNKFGFLLKIDHWKHLLFWQDFIYFNFYLHYEKLLSKWLSKNPIIKIFKKNILGKLHNICASYKLFENSIGIWIGQQGKGEIFYVKSWSKAASQLPLTTRSVEIVNLIESEKTWLCCSGC